MRQMLGVRIAVHTSIAPQPGPGWERKECLMTRLCILLVISLTVLALMPASVAQELPLQYAVKFVCGKSDSSVVVPGLYFTSVNVHNPGREAAGFLKKFAVTRPRQTAGPVTKLIEAKLGSDEAFAIECREIVARTHSTGFVEGFVVIESRVELDVVAVYTASGSTGQVQTMELERVPVRRTQ